MRPSRRVVLGAAAALALPRFGRAQATMAPGPWTDAWGAVLRQHVDAQGRVDFAGIAAAPGPLQAVVATVAAVDPRNRPELFPAAADGLAYWLNAYNALAMWGIVQRGIPRRLDLLDRFGFFARTEFPVGGRTISLKALEDSVIRPLGEERVHFALNCMVRGCPRLSQEPFRGARLEAQLAAAAREFCESGYQVRPDPPNRSVFLSEIFSFYTRDFTPAKAPSLLAYVNRWRREPVPAEWTARFFDYDWTINAQPGRSGG